MNLVLFALALFKVVICFKKEVGMRVKNINGTSAYTCKCGSWLDHWKKFSGQSLSNYCSEETVLKNQKWAHMFRKIVLLMTIGISFLFVVLIMGKPANH